jgi:hypothetical protein
MIVTEDGSEGNLRDHRTDSSTRVDAKVIAQLHQPILSGRTDKKPDAPTPP